MGYTGLIHNFKNYILRQDRKYLEHAEENILASMVNLEQLDQLQSTEAELNATLVIRNVINEYRAIG